MQVNKTCFSSKVLKNLSDKKIKAFVKNTREDNLFMIIPSLP